MIRKIIRYLILSILSIILIVIVLLFARPLWNRLILYPQLDKHRNQFISLYKPTQKIDSLKTFRGVMHLHSYWSHDSEGTLFDLIPAAKSNGIDFIFLTDHPRGSIDTLPRGYKGYYDGVLIEPGSEKQGFDAWPLDTVVIDWSVNRDTVAKNIIASGGIIFYAHTEEPHNWTSPYYQGMEIYNFHTDTKDESLLPHIANFIVNGNKYRHWAYRQMFDEQADILSLWDSLNTVRKIVGFSAVDVHENQNYRARYLDDGRIEWVGPNANVIDTVKLRFRNRWLFHEPDSSGWIFKWIIDTYETSFSYITNYVFADTLSIPDFTDHIKKGHLFTAFKNLGDAYGFNYYCIDNEGNPVCIMGDSVLSEEAKSLKAVSPFPGQFRLIHDGRTVDISSDDSYHYSWDGEIEKGAWRIEVHIKPGNRYIPWLYTNPIYVY